MIDVAELSDEALSALLADGLAEQRRRAEAVGDIDAIVEAAFEAGFDSRGQANPPWVTHGLLVCPGSIRERSTSSHDCVFVHVDGNWVWQSDDLIIDVVRSVPQQKHTHQRSITLLAAVEGTEYDVVASKMRQGVHHATHVRSYRISNGEPVLVTKWAARPSQPPR